jgi:hypothetical protein
MKNRSLLLTCFILGALASSAQTFSEVSSASGIDQVFDFGDFHFGGGAAVIDFNNDGWEDLYVVGGVNPDALYMNNGDGTFTDVIAGAGMGKTDSVLTMGAIAGDFDNDGWADLYLTSRCRADNFNAWAPNLLYKNNGNGTFTDVSVSSLTGADTSFSTSAAFGDYNNDGLLDIYVLNFLGVPVYSILDSATTGGLGPLRPGSPSFLYVNNGNGTFTDLALQTAVVDSGCGWATVFTDYDLDNDLDIYIANDFGKKTKPNTMYRNEFPTDIFSDEGANSGTNAAINGMGVAVGDYNEDGWLDYYVTDLDTNILYKNNGDGTFDDVTLATGTANTGWNVPLYKSSVGWGTNFLDFDNDTYLDLFVCNGSLNPMMPMYNMVDTFLNYNVMYRNNGNGTFNEVSTLTGLNDPQRGRGSVMFDYDNDGDLDLVVVNQVHYDGYGVNESPRVQLFRNDEVNDNSWVKVQLQGTLSNFNAIGARVRVVIGNRSLIREINAGSSHLSSDSPIAHFGLGGHVMIDTMEVTWPGGTIETFTNVAVNQSLTIIEGITVSTSDLSNTYQINVYPNPFEDVIILEVPQVLLNQELTFVMKDLAGRVVYEENNIHSTHLTIQRDNWSNGIYMYQLKKADTIIESGRLVAR